MLSYLEIAIALVQCGDVECKPTGSRYICTPAPMDTDEDYIVYMEPEEVREEAYARLDDLGFTMEGGKDDDYESEDGHNGFRSFRRETLNIILTFDRDFYNSFCKATEFCKLHNVLPKPRRIEYFRAFLYGENWPEGDIADPRMEEEGRNTPPERAVAAARP